MREAGIPVTRENYIAMNWGEPVPEWMSVPGETRSFARDMGLEPMAEAFVRTIKPDLTP